MSTPRQDPDPIRLVEEALVALRHNQAHGRLRQRGDHGFGREGDPRGHAAAGEFHEHEHEHRPGFGRGGRRPGGRDHGGLGGAAKFRLLDALRTAKSDGRQMGVSEVAQAIGVDQPRASRLVNESAERGLVTRKPDPRDARRSVIEITASGRSLLESAHSNRRAAVTEALAGFTAEEKEQFAGLLARFAASWPRD